MKQTKPILKEVATVFIMLFLLGIVASAYDAGTPYTVTMNLIVPSDTSFTVTLAGAETTIDFNPASKTVCCVQPDSQNNGTSTPIATITNTGNLNANYSVNLTAGKPSWVVLKANNGTSYAGASTYDTTALTLAGWNNTAPSGNATVYLWADFTNAIGGTTARTFQINAKES